MDSRHLGGGDDMGRPLVGLEHVGKGQGEKSLRVIYQSPQPGPQAAPKVSPSPCKPMAEKPGYNEAL